MVTAVSGKLTISREGLIAVSEKTTLVEGVIHRCTNAEPPKCQRLYPKYAVNSEQKPEDEKETAEARVESELAEMRKESAELRIEWNNKRLSAENDAKMIQVEMHMLKKEITQMRKELVTLGKPNRIVSSCPPPLPPPPLPVGFLRSKPKQLQIKQNARKSEEILGNPAVKKIDMSDVLKNIGKVTLRKTDKSPGGTPMRRPSVQSEPNTEELMRDRVKLRSSRTKLKFPTKSAGDSSS